MRLDRLITLNLVQPFRRAFSLPTIGRGLGRRSGTSGFGLRTSDFGLPILMYHSVSDHDETVSPYFVTNTRPAAFRAQMRFLAENDYRTVNLETAWREDAAADRRVVITFDDAFRDFYTTAFPVLREFGFTATMFVPTAFIGETSRAFSPRSLTPSPRRGEGRGEVSPSSIHPSSNSRASRECMTWDEIRTLADAGIHFGSHTVSHPKLRDLDWPEIEQELTESKRTLEQELGREIATFAYPFAYPQAETAFVHRFESLLKQVGYRCNVTTRIGRVETGDDPYSLRRLPMNSFDDNRLLQAKLTGGYDWLAHPQAATKRIKRWLPLS